MGWQQQRTVKGRWERKRSERNRQPDNENSFFKLGYKIKVKAYQRHQKYMLVSCV